MSHAILSASGSHLWLHCTRSARLQQQFPDQESRYSLEGTFGHAVFAHRLSQYLGTPSEYLGEDFIPGYAEFFNAELSGAVDEAIEHAKERIVHARSVCAEAVILIEQRLDFSPWVPEGFGTADLVIITDNYIEVIDLKLGSGVLVSATENSQFRLYMLGALHTFGHLYPVTAMHGAVLQPRLNNYAREELSLEDLLCWADQVVKPRAALAWAGEGEFIAGDHCSSGFCKARFTCAARASKNMQIAKADFALIEPALLNDEQIVTVLQKADAAIKWLSDVQSYALSQAIAGRSFEGFKVVAGRAIRKYTDEDQVASALLGAGVSEGAIYERRLLGITAMEKAIGKKQFATVLGDLVTKPAGNPVLVPVSDRREAINSTVLAVADFSL